MDTLIRPYFFILVVSFLGQPFYSLLPGLRRLEKQVMAIKKAGSSPVSVKVNVKGRMFFQSIGAFVIPLLDYSLR